MTGRGPRANPSGPTSDLDACEAAIGAALPPWLRERLAVENGWEVDDHGGLTDEDWRFLPVLDRSDRKARTRTAEDITWHTRRLREAVADAGADIPPGAVVVARAYSETRRLVLLPDPADPGVLAPTLWRQERLEPVQPTPVDLPGHGAPSSAEPAEVAQAAPRDRSELPAFRYHPDPVATGFVVEDPDAVCPSCEQRTGWRYALQPAGPGSQPTTLCPWCISDGSAAARFDSEFVADVEGEVPEHVAEELRRRTPGFEGWQEERWLTHCGDVAAFRGVAGWDEVRDLPGAVADLKAEGWDSQSLQALHADGDARAYLFRCLKCGADLAYSDAS